MATADEYNQKQLDEGLLGISHITALVREFQKFTGFLDVDGKCGPKTLAEIEKLFAPKEPTQFSLFWPLRTLPDGRKPLITSKFRTESRPNHNGVDLFYPWRKGDKPDTTGDRLAAGKDSEGNPRWVVPYGEFAYAAGSGKVIAASKIDSGFRVWIDHGNGMRTGYLHLLDLHVRIGDIVSPGAKLGLIGDNPIDNDARHLHFELSPVDRYAPVDPEPYLRLFLYPTP